MRTLCVGIETSCDESSVAVVAASDSGFDVLSNVISSQVSLHEQYGGVVPELASREHLVNLPIVFQSALQNANISKEEISLFGVTTGPGLKGCLLVGKNFIEGVNLALQKKLVGVNHIEGHVLSVFIEHPNISFPFLSLIVSGGHTELQLVKDIGAYELFSRTGDDAAGEAFDKSATLLNLPYPGGAELSKLAATCTNSPFTLPIGMRGKDSFSFSGFKTAVSLLKEAHPEEKDRASIAFAAEKAIVDALYEKTVRAVKKFNVKHVAVSGGVSANSRLRSVFSSSNEFQSYFVAPEYCTDNAAMIAVAALLRSSAGFEDGISNDVLPRWPLEIR